MDTLLNLEYLLSRKVVALDCEASGLDWLRGDKVFGVSLAWRDDENKTQTWYGDIREDGIRRQVRDIVTRLPRIVAHYGKFDAHMLRVSDLPYTPGAMDCTLVRECILDEDKYDYSLERISQDRLRRGKVSSIWPELATLFGGKPDKETQAKNLQRAPRHMVAEYAKRDVANALDIWYQQEMEIAGEELQQVGQLERSLLEVVVDMERGGVRVDVNRAEESIPQIDKLVREQQKELDRLAGYPVNVNSSPQTKKLLGVHQEKDGRWFTRDGLLLEPTESGKSGELRSDKLYQCTLPEASLIAQIRGLIKARDVFLGTYICKMNHKGYVHANINQTRSEEGDGTYTGRFSITEPALQQIHKRNKKMAAIVRSCFLPDAGCDWLCWDWSQVDFRVFAHYLNDPRIIERYKVDPRTDFHGLIANLTRLPRDRDEKTGGANAKQINLAMVFGMSAGRMAKEMNLPYTKDPKGYFRAGPEAEGFFNQYHSNVPGVQRLKDSVASVAKSRGYIRTQLGRRIRFPDANKAYKAAGILYQGEAAEMMKVKLVELHAALRSQPDYRLMLTVHDEFDVSGRLQRGSDDPITELLQRFDGSNGINMRIPILADLGKGVNWYEASL